MDGYEGVVCVRVCEGVVYVRVCEDVCMGMRGWCA